MFKKIVALCMAFALCINIQAFPFSWTLLTVPYGYLVDKISLKFVVKSYDIKTVKGKDLSFVFQGKELSCHPNGFTRQEVKKIIQSRVPALERVIYLGPESECALVPNKDTTPLKEPILLRKNDIGAHVKKWYDKEMNDIHLLCLPSIADLNLFTLHHEITHIVEKNKRTNNNQYNKMMPFFYIGVGLDILTSKKLSFKQKLVRLGSLYVGATLFHKQSYYALERSIEQSADDGVPDQEDVLEDGVKFFSRHIEVAKKEYKEKILEQKNFSFSIFNMIDGVECFITKKCRLKEGQTSLGYRLWRLLVADPEHPVVDDRLERMKLRLARVKELNRKQKEEEQKACQKKWQERKKYIFSFFGKKTVVS